VRRYLFDTAVMLAYLKGRAGALSRLRPWVLTGEASTSLIVYGEVIEYLKSFPDYSRHRTALRTLMRQIYPHELTYAILERYADLRRALRPPHGGGLIGDADTLIAATALEHGLIVVTTDSDYTRVPGLSVVSLTMDQLKA
jgi:tRNA(fMet)-specific endonuclease VapC